MFTNCSQLFCSDDFKEGVELMCVSWTSGGEFWRYFPSNCNFDDQKLFALKGMRW